MRRAKLVSRAAVAHDGMVPACSACTFVDDEAGLRIGNARDLIYVASGDTHRRSRHSLAIGWSTTISEGMDVAAMVESTAAEPELAYHPVLGDLDDLIVPEVTSVLIVDGAVPTTLNFGAVSVRTTHPDGPPLPTGIYRFVADSGVALMAVDSASLPGAPASCSWEAPD